MFFEILQPKTKPITVVIIYQPPNQNNFLKTLNENFVKLDTLKKELYILGDFNIYLYQNQNHTGYKKHTLVSLTVSNDVKNYLQFCAMFNLTQIIKSPTRIICSSTSLIDHILASLPERISYFLNVSFIALGKLVELKLEVCTKKIKFCSLKNYVVDAYKSALRKINLPNYEYFEDVSRAYLDFFQKLMTVIDNFAPCKATRVKGNTQNWFNREVLEKLRSRDKLFKVFKKTRLHTDQELYEKDKYMAYLNYTAGFVA